MVPRQGLLADCAEAAGFGYFGGADGFWGYVAEECIPCGKGVSAGG